MTTLNRGAHLPGIDTQIPLFMRNIPSNMRDDDLKITLARYIHRPPFRQSPLLNFHIRLFRANNQKWRCGLLTLPTAADGEMFMVAYSKGIMVSGVSRVLFSRNDASKRPEDTALIAQVAATPWVDPAALQEEAEKRRIVSSEIPLEHFSFGRLTRDGEYSIEVETRGNATVCCDPQHRRVRLSLREEADPEEIDYTTMPSYAWFRAAQIGMICEPDMLSAPYDVFLEANAPPVFEAASSIQDTTSERSESIFGHEPMANVGRLVCLTFSTRDGLDTFIKRCKQSLHMRHFVHFCIPKVYRDIYSPDREKECQTSLAELPFPLAFEADKALAAGVLDPPEVIDLCPALQNLHDVKRDEAPAIFRWFIAHIPAPSLKNLSNLSLKDMRAAFSQVERVKRKKKNRRQRGRAAADRRQYQQQSQPQPQPEELLPDPTLTDLLEMAVKVYAPELPRTSRLMATPTPAIYQSYHMILAPSARILEGPLPDQSSSILRRFGNNDNFLRITFQDDNRLTLRQDTTLNISIKSLLASRYKRALTDGIHVAGRKFEFLGYSMSGLKQHSVFFVAPFWFDLPTGRTLMTGTAIRDTLGDFSMIANKPALLAARWAQVFSASSPSITLQASEIRQIEDRRSSTGSLFTDGCSPMSRELCRAAWERLKGQQRSATRARLIPVCFQIRMAGAKGVIFMDPTLSGRVLCLRKSQTKFESTTLTLDIASTLARPIRMYLNRPLIMLLEHLGVKDPAFISLQNDAIDSVERIRTSFSDSSKLFQQHGLGTSFRLSSLFNNFVKVLRLEDDDVAQGTLQCDLLTTSLAYAATHVLRELKFRARIPVPGSYTLIGVSDEWGCLREGEIFATVRDEKNGVHKRIEGKVLITRSPQIHPGDVQFVTAVRRPELEHLHNVVVFSCEGKRSLPSCLGGGDLDGDIYNIIINPDLFPQRTVEPGSYKGLPHKETPEPCTVPDIADFVLNYLEADLVGMIATRHLCIADTNEQGPECNDCLLLAEYASHAVDFPKTGTPVDFKGLPKAPSPLKPDFLSTELTDPTAGSSFYPSAKILGKLFRRVPLKDDTIKEASPSFGPLITEALEDMDEQGQRRLGLPSIWDTSEALEEEMDALLETYKTDLLTIAQAHTMSKQPNDRLSEAELVSGTIQAKWADHHKRRETVASMNLQTQQLTKAVRRELRRVDAPPAAAEDAIVDEEDDEEDDDDDEDRLSNRDIEAYVRAGAAWQAADDELAENPHAFGASSFGLVALGVMLGIVKKARRITRY